MNRKENLHFDVAVVGAGVTGLILLKQLTELGYKTALVEKAPKLAGGPSTRNEGMIHRGTRHAVSIANSSIAEKVVSRSIYGHEFIKQYAPESINDLGVSFIAALTANDNVDYVTSRWRENNVHFTPISKEKFRDILPEANHELVEEAFFVSDLSINTKMLYQKLLHNGLVAGGEIFTNTKFKANNLESGDLITPDGEIQRITAEKFVITTGYDINEIYNQITGNALDIRFWKSHLVVVPRLAKHGLIFVGNGETITAHQGDKSIIGQWEDATIVDKPDNVPIKEKAEVVFQAGVRAFPDAEKYEADYMSVACIKPDIANSLDQSRSVDVQVFTPSENYILALPGKMTEAPFVANVISQMISSSISDNMVADRPVDTYKL